MRRPERMFVYLILNTPDGLVIGVLLCKALFLLL